MENVSLTTMNDSLSTAQTNSCQGGVIRTDYFNDQFTWTFAAILIIVSISAIVGNFYILRNRANRDVDSGMNLLLCNIAVVDLLTGALSVPTWIHTFTQECWDMFDSWCVLNRILIMMFYGTSLHTLMYISIYKYVSIHRTPLNKDKGFLRAVCMCTASWAWGLLETALDLLSKSPYIMNTTDCESPYNELVDDRTNWFPYGIHIPFTTIPKIIMIFAYFKIFTFIRSKTQVRHQISTANKGLLAAIDCPYQKEKEEVKTLIIVLACFFLCWTPYYAASSYRLFGRTREPYALNLVVSIFILIRLLYVSRRGVNEAGRILRKSDIENHLFYLYFASACILNKHKQAL